MQPTDPEPNKVEPKSFRVDMDQVPSIIPVGCPHDWVEDPTDETDFYVAVTCVLCHRGYLKRKKLD